MADLECTVCYGKSPDADKEILEDLAECDSEALVSEYTAKLAEAPSFDLGASRAASDTPDETAPDGVYYINFTPSVADQYRPQLIAMQADVDSFRSWATGLAGITVQRQMDLGKLDSKNISKVSSYRAKVLDNIYDQRNTVLNKQQAANNSSVLSVKEKNFHSEIIKTALTGFTLGVKALATLEGIITSIVDSLKKSEKYRNIQRRYFIFATSYIFDTITKTIKVQMRTINFESTNETFEVATSKSTTTYVKVNVAFSGYNYDFNRTEWLTAKETPKVRELMGLGRDRMGDDPTLDPPVDD